MVEGAKRKKEIVNDIKINYRRVERSIVEQLYMKQTLHGPTAGTAREDSWGQLFEMVLPKKFVIEQSVFIIDSKKGVSGEIDLAIIDEMYTPYIFRYGRLKFIPIEAVAAVIECKSKTIDEDTINEWSNRIKGLVTSDDSIARIAMQIAIGSVATQKSTRPIKILCTLKSALSKPEHMPQYLKDAFDFVLIAVMDEKTDDAAHIDIITNSSLKNLFDWYEELNYYGVPKEQRSKWLNANNQQQREILEERTLKDYSVADKEGKGAVSLLTFNFQFNQLLMLINNPMLFPHRAYAKMFQDEMTDSV